MENLLKKQLAQIKARALALAGRASESDGASAGPSPEAGREIIEAIVRTGAVTRGADPERLKPARRFPWWFRRRMARERESGFEAEFRRALDDLLQGEPVSIEAAVPGEPRTIDDTNYYLIRAVGSEVDADEPAVAERFGSIRSWPAGVVRTVVGGHRGQSVVDRSNEATPESVLFLDIETAGLSANTYVFLCGLMYWSNGGFAVEQVFARDYTEEEGLLRHARTAIDRFGTVVTYNGASFDIPFLRTRMEVHRVPDIEPVGSVDLLHSSRRVFREELPNCKLVTVERHLRGVDRVDDIPSRFIPRAYHEFVRTKDARIMRNVVYHNRMDLFTMAVMLNHFATTAEEAAGGAAAPENSFAPSPRGDTMSPPNPPRTPF
jgi:uncharacterized protein YprB with RNaseH-like and TPR domain